MKLKASSIGVSAMVAVAGTTLVLSTASYAQGRDSRGGEGDSYSAGLERLAGRGEIGGRDERFTPMAMAVISGPETGAAKMGKKWFSETAWKHAKDTTTAFHQTIYQALRPGGVLADARPLSPGDLLKLKTLFANGDFTRTRSVSVSSTGITGDFTLKDVGLSEERFAALTKEAAAKARSAAAEIDGR